MIKRAMQRMTQDKAVYTNGYVMANGNPHLVIYGSAGNPFVLAENIPKWLDCQDKSYQSLLESVDDSERMVKLIAGDDGKSHPKWCVTKNGACQILEALFTSVDISYHEYFCELIQCIKSYQESSTKSQDSVDNTTQQRYTVTEILENPDILIDALNRLKEEQMKNRQLTAELSVQSEKIAELEPKADYYDKVLNTANGVSPSVIAKEYGKSAMWLNKLLHSLKIQYKQGETWVLYSRYVDKEYTCTKTHQYTDEFGVTRSVMHTYWTQAGRKFIYDTLKKHNIEPIT